MADGPLSPHGERKAPQTPGRGAGEPAAPSRVRSSWTTFALGPRGSPRRTAAVRGVIAGLVVLVIGLPLAIALPGGGSPAAAPSPSAGATHKGKPHCAHTIVAGGEKPAGMQPASAAPDDTVFVFGPTLRAHGNRPVPPGHIEVWLNTDEPDVHGTPLGSGPVKELASETAGHGCTFAASFAAPRLPNGPYEIRAFQVTDTSKQGWESLGGRTLTIERHPGPAGKKDASTFAADFLLARLSGAGSATKAMLAKSAEFPAAGDPGALFAKSYRSAKVTSVRPASKGAYQVDVKIVTADGPAIEQTLEVGEGTNLRGDDLALVVTGARTARNTASPTT